MGLRRGGGGGDFPIKWIEHKGEEQAVESFIKETGGGWGMVTKAGADVGAFYRLWKHPSLEEMKDPSFPPWAEIWGWLLNNGPLLAAAGHRTQRLAPSEQKRLCTWMSKCWSDEVSSVSQGVSQVRQNISVCWMTHLCQIVFVLSLWTCQAGGVCHTGQCELEGIALGQLTLLFLWSSTLSVWMPPLW